MKSAVRLTKHQLWEYGEQAEESVKRGYDWIFMIAYPEIFDLDLPICCEVKTKIDSTRQIAAKSVLNSLKDAKRQLPKDKPGVVFVRLVGSSEVQEIIDAVQSVEYAANEFLRSTKRVIAVCVVTHHVNDYASFHELRPFLKRVVNRDIGKL